VRNVGEAFERDNQRKALVVMATGAGKTRTVIALVDLLMRCNWAKRVLFLADRLALVKQAVNAFKAHLPDAAPVNLVTEKDGAGRVFVCTYPSMMGMIDDRREGQNRFGVGHFDLVVIDEAHRSVYQKYGKIFNYFDALLVGLTATPKEDTAHDTYGLFDLETGVPTDAYNLGQAVDDKFLVPMNPRAVPLRFQREGIRYDDLSEAEKEQWDMIEWDEDGNTPDSVDNHALNEWLFNKDTVDKALAYLMTHGQKVGGNDQLGKTIIFAKNNLHADFIAQRFDANYPHYQGEFARVITYKVNYAQTLIEAFEKPDKRPNIAISVDMLDTGVDVPSVLNLVFFKPVRSKTKFWQMVGRGTRLCPDVFGPGRDKAFFSIFDFCQNLEYFGANPPSAEGVPGVSLSTRLFRLRLDMLAALDRKLALADPLLAHTRLHLTQGAPGIGQDRGSYGAQSVAQTDETQLRGELANLLCHTVAGMNLASFVVRPQRESVEKYARPESWISLRVDDFEAMGHKLADLPTALQDDEEEAKRFDVLLLRAQLGVLQGQHDLGSLQERVQELMRALATQDAIPAIHAHIVLIDEIAGDEWWQDVTVPMLELARKRLRKLIKLIEKGKKRIIYTDFEDELGEHSEVALPASGADMDLAKFKDKARAFLRAHQDHLALQRLRRNLALTASDLAELEQMLLQAGGSPQLIEQAKQQSAGLGVFIRSLVGMERDAARAALSQFISGSTASASQIEFIDLIIEHLTENGVMPAERLYESPFTDINPQGPEGLFPSATVARLVGVLVEIGQRAAA
jgi:type I restriction enzyme R subunit